MRRYARSIQLLQVRVKICPYDSRRRIKNTAPQPCVHIPISWGDEKQLMLKREQNSKDSTEISCIPLPQLPLIFASYITMDHVAQPHWYTAIGSVEDFILISPRFHTQASFCSRIQSSISWAWSHHVYRISSSLVSFSSSRLLKTVTLLY